MTTPQEKISSQIRTALEIRLAQVLKIEREDLPVLSLAEIVSLLFAVQGQTNILGGFGETTSAIRTLIGDDSFWRRPKPNSNEPTASGLVQ